MTISSSIDTTYGVLNQRSEENIGMEPVQMAVMWMAYDQLQRSDEVSRRDHSADRPSVARRFGIRLRRIAYRGQLGPVGGHAAA